MKRYNDLFRQVSSIENLNLADKRARKGKLKQYGVLHHDRNREEHIILLQEMLTTKTYKTSPYGKFKIREPKERIIYKLPYYPDRILHHAVMNVLEPIFVKTFTTDTYSCIKGRGIHGAQKAVIRALKDVEGTKYCLKLDIKQFYPSIDHEILKTLLRRKIKDKDLLWLLDEIIDSVEGVPIGNYLSQYFANFYLTGFDHWLKEVKGVKYYFRYADDMVILSDNKEHLHALFAEIQEYLTTNLKLEIKANYQVFPVDSRGLDFVGYRFYHGHVRLRKSIKKNFARSVAKKSYKSIPAYNGWTVHCKSRHLVKKLMYNNNYDLIEDVYD